MEYNIPERAFSDIISIAKKNKIKKVILFGSRARGTHKERSDIDLAVSGGNAGEFYSDLEDDAWFCVRPSGTEPKIKFYAGIKGSSMEDADSLLNKLLKGLEQLA